MNLDEKIKKQLEYLCTMLEKYQELNQKTKGKYGYRQNAIECEVELLESLLDESGIDTTWDNCYLEDSKGVE